MGWPPSPPPITSPPSSLLSGRKLHDSTLNGSTFSSSFDPVSSSLAPIQGLEVGRHLSQQGSVIDPLQYWAQVGKAITFTPNYDNIGQAMLSVFVLITQDNYDANMKMTMTLTDYWTAALFTVITLVIGVYLCLNLFLAILLANLDEHEVVHPTSLIETAKSIQSLASYFGTRISIFLKSTIRQVI